MTTTTIEPQEKTPPRARGRVLLGVMRWLITVHAATILSQPVFAGRYMIGDYDMLAHHRFGADAVTSLALAQVVLAALLWWRRGMRWPFWASLLLFAGETGQYFAGLAGALDVHFPLGVALAVYASVMTLAIWRSTGDEAGSRR